VKALFDKHTLVWLTILAVGVLLAGCAEAKTVYVDDYRELRPYTTTVLSETLPAPDSQPSAVEPVGANAQAQVSGTGG